MNSELINRINAFIHDEEIALYYNMTEENIAKTYDNIKTLRDCKTALLQSCTKNYTPMTNDELFDIDIDVPHKAVSFEFLSAVERAVVERIGFTWSANEQ